MFKLMNKGKLTDMDTKHEYIFYYYYILCTLGLPRLFRIVSFEQIIIKT